MSGQDESPGIAICCDSRGVIEHVLIDDLGIFSGDLTFDHFIGYASRDSRDPALAFFARIVSDGSASVSGIEFGSALSPHVLMCTGFRWKDGFLVFGALTAELLGAVMARTLFRPDIFEKFTKSRDETEIMSGNMHADTRFYDDMSRLNSELVNMHRDLANAEVEIRNQADKLKKEVIERQKIEDALRMTNKKLNILSSITRHDILNTLTGLRIFIELSKETVTDEQTRSFIEKEDQAAEAITKQIEFTRSYQDIGMQSPVWQNVAECIRTATHDLPLGTIKLEIDLVPVEIFADPMLERVFFNLPENAIRHGESISTIRFRIEENNNGLIIFCEDDGVGVPADKKEAIFNRQYFKHTGFGLYLSREILSITGITITESGEQGKGARFEIAVPKEGYRFTGKA
jgi:signal transduction histidine kinase